MHYKYKVTAKNYVYSKKKGAHLKSSCVAKNLTQDEYNEFFQKHYPGVTLSHKSENVLTGRTKGLLHPGEVIVTRTPIKD